VRCLVSVLALSAIACNTCPAEPCPFPGWDPHTCACIGNQPQNRDASLDADASQDAVVDAGGSSEACLPEPCPYPGWDPKTCACRRLSGDAGSGD
jgi:hypothetical protein